MGEEEEERSKCQVRWKVEDDKRRQRKNNTGHPTSSPPPSSGGAAQPVTGESEKYRYSHLKRVRVTKPRRNFVLFNHFF